MHRTDRTLFLYTSNIRERYIADALAVVALPDGARIRFRYDRRHVSEELSREWSDLGGMDALIIFHFSTRNGSMSRHLSPFD